MVYSSNDKEKRIFFFSFEFSYSNNFLFRIFREIFECAGHIHSRSRCIRISGRTIYTHNSGYNVPYFTSKQPASRTFLPPPGQLISRGANWVTQLLVQQLHPHLSRIPTWLVVERFCAASAPSLLSFSPGLAVTPRSTISYLFSHLFFRFCLDLVSCQKYE